MYSIRVKDITKKYELYEKPIDRLKEAMSLSKKSYHRNFYALNHVSFDVVQGETIGIIGTNGSGKSTILKIITGVLSPTAGELEINGRISALLELGAGFNMDYTGIENIYMNGIMMGYTREEMTAKLPDILEFADIGDFVNHPVKSYSSGMFVRLAFSVAINIEPEILIVDEALSVGDVFFQNKCYRKFEEFKQQGKTILFVSHDLSSICKYCDRVVLLNAGTKRAEGSPQEMVDLYKKIMVGADPLLENEKYEKDLVNFPMDENILWKDSINLNPNVNEYGNGEAEIIDVGVFDEEGLLTSTIIKGKKFTLRSKVCFHANIQDPIFTFTIKTIKGTDITGTNTMLEKKSIGNIKNGDVVVASFTQEMNLQGGEYLLSMSCTGYNNGEFVAYHRLYDVVNITVVSDKNTVGFYDMNSEVEITKVNE